MGSRAGATNHWATELADGRVLDPTLRDNLAAAGGKFADIPSGKKLFSKAEWEQLQQRFPIAGGE